MNGITEEDYKKAAESINVEVAAIKAVDEVESRGAGFLESGEPKILFEGHVFWKELKKKGINPKDYVEGNEDILYEKWTKKFYLGGQAEHKRLAKAIKINREAALASASWGRYQVMGNNWKDLGYKSIQDFINAMYKDEVAHLDSFVRFVKANKLVVPLRTKNWAVFASVYNGSGYKANAYDTKMANAYKKFNKK